MKAFHNDPKIKKFYLNRVKAHAAADEIVKGIYWVKGKGCAVGCTVHSADHLAYETELGIPQMLAQLEDLIFEKLPNDLAKTWPSRFLTSIRIGADLSGVWDHFAYRLLSDPIGGVLQYAKTEDQREVIQIVSDLYSAKIEGLEVPKEKFLAAYSEAYAADDAAAYVAYAVAYPIYDAVVASAVAYAVASAVASAVVAYSAAARGNGYIWQSELLLELLHKA